jgi:signal transduction histidine kinase
MDGMMQNLGIILAIYTVRGIVVFADYKIAFEHFFNFQSNEHKKKDWIWVGFYLAINFLYRPIINYGPKSLHLLLIVLYLIRIVPFLWSRYGCKSTYLVIALFYGGIANSISQNIHFVFFSDIKSNIYNEFKADVSIMIAEIIVLIFFLLLLLFKRAGFIKVHFTKLTIAEYILLFLLDMSFSILEVVIFQSGEATNAMKKFSIVTFILLISLIIHIIMVREQNTSMNAMIGNLKEPMKQITDSYIEMNEKNTELRRFRHDAKNLLLALRSIVSEGKIEQAVDYIDKMQDTVETIKVKAFDTGNFIADALLESKAKVAAQNNIAMTVTGNIPANRVEDVNLVILISNLLDNAIEAAKQVDGERKIEIQSILKKNIWILAVKNSCVKDVVIRENHIETTKDNKEAHGFGLSNIERVTRKYAGELQLSCENQVFTARTTMMLMT